MENGVVMSIGTRLSRRSLMAGAAGIMVGAGMRPRILRAAADETQLVAAPGRAAIAGPDFPDTAVWSYNAAVPGPELRLRQGERLRVVLENRLKQDTTIHWHGVRVPNAMDGVPDLTQPSIAPGTSFVYEFSPPDA